jgi:hypothetical protein
VTATPSLLTLTKPHTFPCHILHESLRLQDSHLLSFVVRAFASAH